MKRLASVGIVLVALSGMSSVLALDLPKLCGDFWIMKSPETRVYRGQFKAQGVALETALIVTEVTDAGEALVFYVWGRQPRWGIDAPGCTVETGTFDGDTLTVRLQRRLTVTYVFDEDGKASVEYVRKRSGGTRRTRGEVILVQ